MSSRNSTFLRCLGGLFLLLLMVAPTLADDVWLTGRPAPHSWIREKLLSRGWTEFPKGSLGAGEWWRNSSGDRVMVLDWQAPEPALAALSDHPEKVERIGGLFFGGLTKMQPLLFQYYHLGKLEGPEPQLNLVVSNPGSRPARLYYRDAIGKPSLDYFSSGHTNNTRWFRNESLNLGEFLTVPPRSTLTLLKQELRPEFVVSGTVEMTLVQGPPLQFAFVARQRDDQTLALNNLLKEDDVHSRGFYPLPLQRMSRTYSSGEPPLHLTVGALRQQTFSGVKELRGDYGVFYRAELKLLNPSAEEVEVELVFNPRGGAATATFQLDGELLELPLTQAFEERVIRSLRLPPFSETRTTLRTIPEGASSYPIRVIVRTKP